MPLTLTRKDVTPMHPITELEFQPSGARTERTGPPSQSLGAGVVRSPLTSLASLPTSDELPRSA
jgi:hypothetical protein